MGSISSEALPIGQASTPDIIDIRSDTGGIELRQEILNGLKPKDGAKKTLPTLLLYDEAGLRLFEEITYLDEYYLTNQEIWILENYAERIADRIPDGALIVELGSGNLRKVKILLDALERARKTAFYFALDLMHSELQRTLDEVPLGSFKYVHCAGLWGTYDDGLAWLKRPENAARPKAILSLGSSIGNFKPEEAIPFIAQFTRELKPNDVMLVALDACQDAEKVYHAYNDRGDVTHNFTMNGLKHANKLLGYDAFDPNEWEAAGRYDAEASRHRAFVVPKADVTVEGVCVKKGEFIQIEESNKVTKEVSDQWWDRQDGSYVSQSSFFSNKEGTYFLHLLSPGKMLSTSKPEEYAAHPVPSLHEWHELWRNWDTITQQMIPHKALYEKPIKLRNACIFYLGHIPTFLDMKLTEATNTKATEPVYFYQIFERGIDPDVDNPEKVHAHSAIPDTWPDLQEILGFQDRVRARVAQLYGSGQAFSDQWTGRALWLGFEHEMMHMETLLYMLLQSDKTLPPDGVMKPDFEQLAAQAKREENENEWFAIPAQAIEIGLHDPENSDGPVRYFGWDVEKPAFFADVKGFQAKARPITNGEYARYLCNTNQDKLPASWMHAPETNGTNGVNGTNGHHVNGEAAFYDFLHGKAVRTVYGSIPLKYALDWPASASYDELAGCAAYMGGRIPTVEEARSIYLHAAELKKKEAVNALGKKIPAVNGHLVNEGVEETPPSKHLSNGSSNGVAELHPEKLFVNLEEANVGFKHWHPMPVTQNGSKLAGLGEMGGLWEWTSSPLERIKGFEPMKLYPAYSEDFYDGKHNVVLGGSWATHPRIAGRNTFVNWYQRNYPFAWAGARIVKDA